MNTKKITLKFILTSIISLILIVMASAGIICLKTNVREVSANNSNMKSIDFTNANFNESTKSSYPYNPSGFTAASGNDSKKAGVINLTHSDYTNKFTNAKRGSMYDNYVLMLEGEGVVNYGFESSSSNNIEIKANSYYHITIDVYTETNSGIASVILYDGDEEFDYFKNINQYLDWGQYHFLISTNDLDSYKLTLGLYLSGSGTALFDNISIYELNKTEFNAAKSQLDVAHANYKLKSSENNVVASYKVVNGEYVNASNSSDKTDFPSHNFNDGDNSTITTETNNDGTNSSAIKVSSTNKTFAHYSTKNDFITFKQGLVYKVSVNAKAENLSSDGFAMLQLVRTGAEDDDASKKDSSIIKISSNAKTEDSITNGYETYSFYVYADPTKDTTYKLVFGLGDEKTLTSGDLYINTLNISKTTYSNYNSASGSTTTKLDLVNHYAYSSTSDLPFLNNANFDAYQIADLKKPFPATPADWEVKTGNGNQLYGVINTSNVSSLDSHNLQNLHIPTTDSDNHNMLMLYNENTDTLSYKSAAKELEANSYNKFEIKVNAQHANVKVSLVTTKDNSDIELTSTTVTTSLNQFETVSLYIHNGNQKLNVALKITLQSTGFGYAYADQARFNYITAPTESIFNDIVAGGNVAKVDLSNILLSDNGKPKFFTSTGSINDMAVFNFNVDSEVANYIAADNYENFKSNLSANEIIVIRSYNETNYKLTSSIGFDVDASKYYVLSVDVFTQNIDSTIEDAKLEEIGAGVKVTGFTNNFTSINTDNNWKTYKLYVNPNTSSTIYLELALGSEENLTKGDAFFTNIKFETLEDMTEEDFKNIQEKDTVKVLAEEEKETDTDEEESTESEPKEKAKINKSLLLYSLSAILFGVAIVIAIVGILVRKIKWKKPVKKSKNEYDRNRTISKQVYTRKATTAREAKIRELNKDLETISEERVKFEEQYKVDLSKLRELKIKRAPAAEISKLEKEMKKNQKLSASLGLTMNKIKADLEYAKTDAYLNALMKQMAREAALQPKAEEETETKPETKKTNSKSKK